MRIYSLLLCMVVLLMSCVPPTKFNSLQTEALSCEEDRERLNMENERLNVEIREIRSRLNTLEARLNQIGKDTLKWKNELGELHSQYNQLNKDYQDLMEANQALIKGSGNEIRRLMDDLQEAQKDMQQKETELQKLSSDLETRRKNLEQMQSELNSRNERLAELEKVLNEQESMVAELKLKVSNALLGFENQGLTVTQKNGKVYVSLDEKLLFKSGSTTVDPNGITALRNLARVLEQNPDIDIMIEGHTDDVPVISGSVYKDNWDLSVLRATAVVRILLEGSDIDPIRITTAGRSQYQPVDPVNTAEARQKNRRTEIILSPKLDELYKLIEGS
ncbi:MAG: OmpA family protein [Bacteroidales bacterium]|nr:OmpA family protein [Bacteroidales bacterium]